MIPPVRRVGEGPAVEQTEGLLPDTAKVVMSAVQAWKSLRTVIDKLEQGRYRSANDLSIDLGYTAQMAST